MRDPGPTTTTDDRSHPIGPRVLIDATAVPADRGGVGRYVDELLPALLAEGEDLAVVCQARDLVHYTTLLPGVLVLPAPRWATSVPGRLLWEQVGLPRLVRSTGARLLHSPHYTFPWASPVPVVVTLHDATFSTHPEVHSPVKSRFFRTWTRWALRRARQCVVPSAATREELVRVVGVGGDRITVAHLGVDRGRFHPPSPRAVEDLRELLELGSVDYVAFLGTLEPRKNVPALIEAWVRACEGRSRPPALVLAGGPGWDAAVGPAVEAVPAQLQLVRAGYLPLELLAPLLGGAQVVAYPSLGEGFGLPVLEAMACGAAVLTSPILSLPEVGGDAVAYSGTSAEEIARGLTALLDDAAGRADLARRARERATSFTWEACARLHRAAYDASLGVPGAGR